MSVMMQAMSGKGVAVLVMAIMIGVLASHPVAATERQTPPVQEKSVQTASETSVGQRSDGVDLKRLPTTDDRAARRDRNNLIEALTVTAVGGAVLGAIGGGLGLSIAAGVAGVYIVLMLP